MIAQDIIQPLKTAIDQAADMLVLLPENAGQEMVAAALGLSQVLQETQKGIVIACPSTLSQNSRSLPGGDQIAQKIGNRNLVISLKVQNRDSIDKVSYNLDETDQVFNLIIQPKKGNQPLKKDDVAFSYSGAKADLIFVVGAARLEDLGSFYESERKLFQDAKTVSLNRFQTATFADFQIQNGQTTGHAELAYELTKALGLTLTTDAATNFLSGIDIATNNLQHPAVNADTFEKVATLMRAGGVRKPAHTPPMPGLTMPIPVSSVRPMPQTNGTSTPMPAAPQIAIPQKVNQPIPEESSKEVPQEWLQPKIYKSTSSK
jgi:nanoRNase/pAp phosphatase (c-di-AMP/oligoRNAs hydrolase)